MAARDFRFGRSMRRIRMRRHCERKRSNPSAQRKGKMDCFVAFAPRNDAALNVVPVNAGTHNHRRLLEPKSAIASQRAAAAYGSRLKAGTTDMESVFNQPHPPLSDGARHIARNDRRSIGRLLALPLHLCCFHPPHQIVGKARKRAFEGLAAFTHRRTVGREGLANGTNGNRT
jgi:hypothetical protein